MSPTYDVTMLLDARVPMRDGVELSADVYLPRDRGPFPTVLVRTPYSNNGDPLIAKGRFLAHQGYAVVLQDCRGRYDSDGVFYPLRHEAEDGCDTQEWVAAQPWCDGSIGTAGGSYLGITQWLPAPLKHPAVKCLAPRVIGTEYFDGLAYPGGAFQLNVLATWGLRTNARTAQNISFHNWTELFRVLPLKDLDAAAGRRLPQWADWVAHSRDDYYWRPYDFRQRFGEITAPAYIMGGWYDLYAWESFQNFIGMREHGGSPEARQSKLLIGPWPHALSASRQTGDVDFGEQSVLDLDGEELRWLGHWLKGQDSGLLDEAPMRLFIMGRNVWRSENEWPLARTDYQRWHLHSRGSANSLLGDGVLAPAPPGDEPDDAFTYDPRFPAPTTGGNNCCSPDIVPWGPYDQRPVEMRGDVLCYTSAPLEADLEVTGPVHLVLYATSDAPDTDWTAKLVDVSPEGYAMNLCDGILRARYRESQSAPTLIEPGKAYEYRIRVGVTGNVFLKGHRIRLEISSSNFPRFDRNLNTGHEPGMDAELRPARQQVHHSAARPSHLILPVV